MERLSAQDVIRLLELSPHPREGGFFRETYRSDESLPAAALPARYAGPRCFGTSIYYLLTDSTFSEMHRLEGDEVFHFHAGDPVEMLHLFPDGSGRVFVLGPDLAAGQRPQVTVPRGVWQGARVAPGGGWSLMGTTVAPGFEYADYRTAPREELCARWPAFAEGIRRLTHG
jgi:predicted cupin superfamily sugar epimerase